MTGKILVVDDDASILYLLRIILRTEGFTVLTCDKEEETTDIVKRERPNLIILDILMPKINGWEVCRALRADPETKKIPVLIMSSLPLKDKERQLARELEVYDYVTKPFEPIQLLGKVKNLFSVPQPLRHLVKETPQQAGVRRGGTARRVEVLVFGGGMAGIAAAQACARNGAEVMLADALPFLGAEMVALNHLAWSAQAHGQDEEKFFTLLKKNGAIRLSAKLNAGVIDPEGARMTAYQLLSELRIPYAMNAHLLDVIRDGTTVKGVVLEGPHGTDRIDAGIIIDTTPNGTALELAGIPLTVEEVEPSINILLGGIDGEALEAGETEQQLYPLPSMREAVLLDVEVGKDWEPFFNEGIEQVVAGLRGKTPGCAGAYLLRRPFSVITARKRMQAEAFPLYGTLIPKTFDQILAAGWPLLAAKGSDDSLSQLYRAGKIAGTLAGLCTSYNQSFREISPAAVRDALKAEGVLG